MLVIRPKTYHGTPGFCLSGTLTKGSQWPIRIWTSYRDLAEQIRAHMKARTYSPAVERAIWDEELRRNLEGGRDENQG